MVVLLDLGLGLGLDVQPGDGAEDMAQAVQLVDGLGERADGVQGEDEVLEAGEVGAVGGFDDVAEDYDEGDEGGVED